MGDAPQSAVSRSGPTTHVVQAFAGQPRTLRLKTAVTLLVLGGTLFTALPLQWAWWHTAHESSLELVDALSQQITATVRREWWERVTAAEAAHGVAASLLGVDNTDTEIARALGAALVATQVPSALSYADNANGPVLATRGDGNQVIIHQMLGEKAVASDLISPPPGWREVAADPAGGQSAIAYSGTAEAPRRLSVFIGMDRFAELLGGIMVSKSGGAFVVDARGTVRIAPDQPAARALLPVAAAAAAIVAQRPANAVNIVESRRILLQDAGYRVSFSPLEFNAWQFVVIVPEAEFLRGIETTTQRTLFTLLVLSVVLGLAAAALAKHVLSEPVAALSADLAKIEQFELEDISHRASRLHEFDQLSSSITRMAAGLADFAKFIPTDLVRTLLAEGVRAVPGGETRQLTVMFADVAGFTRLSERMGIAVIEVISRYLDVVSDVVERNNGTVDKFIGDAVMAFWGAPRPDADRAANACRAALGATVAVRASGLVDDRGEPLRVRIGIESGVAVVGNIGSRHRLNYTAIGDTVNLASRLEGVNKVFGTSILMGEATEAVVRGMFLTREVAEVSVLGRAEPVRIYELLGQAPSEGKPGWVTGYERALNEFRQRQFEMAVSTLSSVLEEQPGDGPSAWLRALCLRLHDDPPPSTWSSVVMLDTK